MHHGDKLIYFYGYWTFAVVDAILQILIICEAATAVFRPNKIWAPGSLMSLVALLACGSVSSAIITWLASPATQYVRQFLVIKGSLFSSILISELLVGMIVLAATSNLPLTTDAARIAEGLGVFSLCGMAIQGLQAHFGLANAGGTYIALSRLNVLAYLATLNYWIFAFRKKSVAPRELPDKLREQLLALNSRMATELRNLQSLGR
jgi:hypothetical protein